MVILDFMSTCCFVIFFNTKNHNYRPTEIVCTQTVNNV